MYKQNKIYVKIFYNFFTYIFCTNKIPKLLNFLINIYPKLFNINTQKKLN